MRRKEETVREWWSILSFLAGSACRVDRFLEDLSSSFHSFSSRLLIFADKRAPFQEPPPRIIRTGRDLLTRDENSSQRPLFPRNVRTCRIMARGEKTKEPSCWTNGEDDRALFFLSTLSPTFSPTLVSDFAVLVGGYFLRKENYVK